MATPGRIDVHHHLVPPAYADFLRERGVRPGGVEVPRWSPEASLKVMRRNGIASSVLSLSTPGAWFGDRGEARRPAREVNDYAAGVVADHPTKFGFFATLTLPDVAGAISEAEYALDVLGADGVVLLSNSANTYVYDPAFAPLLAFLHERRAVAFLHPRRTTRRARSRHPLVHRRLPPRHRPRGHGSGALRRLGEVRRNPVDPRPRRRLPPLHLPPRAADHAPR
ncbi:amidohydrolase family protein [Nocardioides sp. B-3]|uniref:amidohydrolase family protein n=1 Tax=Nocardioides sp. B-3 TaxID=2895565 RepID=UPI002152F76D|nr:amidohydrolase [Nocardioides sp. B-3]UUZ58209.1 amidohydrolase [Nocardioides sp. B-3]